MSAPAIRGVVLVAVAAWPALAAAQFVDKTIVVPDAPAADTAPPPKTERARREREEGDDGTVDVRLTLSSFLYREAGADPEPLVAGGAAPDDASPVRRFFGDARLELGIERLAGGGGSLHLDGRIRQTTSERYQAGAGAGAEYELRTAFYRQALGRTTLRLGRQTVDAVGATRVDGLVIERRLAAAWSATLFGGAAPARGSRSLDTDYAAIRNVDGTTGAPLVPVTAGAGVAYQRPAVHGDLGVGAIHAVQDVPGVSAAAASRVFTTASGYWRPAPWVDLYHYGVLDVAGAGGVHLTNGSLGLDAYPRPALRLTATVHHVDNELLEIGARNLLEDPDPAVMGVVQNDVAVIRVSQDLARLGASLALAQARFELTATGGVSRRPGIDVPLADGGVVTFPAATMAETTLTAVDRRGPAGLRLTLSGSVLRPLGDAAASRSRGLVARAAVSTSGARGDLELDVMAQRFADLGPGAGCTALDALSCYGTASTTAAQAGGLVTWRAADEWLVLIDAHAGVRDATSSTVGMQVAWPRVLSLSAFARLQWRYR